MTFAIVACKKMAELGHRYIQCLRLTCLMQNFRFGKQTPRSQEIQKIITRGHDVFIDFLGSVMILAIMGTAGTAKNCISIVLDSKNHAHVRDFVRAFFFSL